MSRRHTQSICIAFAAGIAASAAAEDVVMRVYPAPEPRPALKYQLLPAFEDQQEGNAATYYFRAAKMYESARQHDPNALVSADMWLLDAPERRPLDEMRGLVSRRELVAALQLLDRGALQTGCDWGVPSREIGVEDLSLATYTSDFMALFRVNAWRAFLAWQDGDIRSALRHYATGFQMARHLGEAPEMLSVLAGNRGVVINTVELGLMVQSPDTPNLYWALATLPDPLISANRTVLAGREWLERRFPLVGEIDDRPLTDAEWEALAVVLAAPRAWTVFGGQPPNAEDEQARRHAAEVAADFASAARETLTRRGFTAAQVDAMTSTERFVRSSLLDYYHWWDELSQWWFVPYWQAEPHFAAVAERFEQSKGDRQISPLAAEALAPSLGNAAHAFAAAKRLLAATMTIEAIRAYVAAHGDLPATLDEVTDWPIPPDPMCGRPFDYRVQGDTFTLESAPPPAGVREEFFRYKVTVVQTDTDRERE